MLDGKWRANISAERAARASFDAAQKPGTGTGGRKVYLDWCRAQGLKPDEKVLAFAESYETKRADLKVLSASA